MRARLIFSLMGTLAVSAFACAKGSGFGDVGGGAAPSTGGAGGAGTGGATASSTTASSSSSSSAASSSSSGTGGGPACTEDPCKLTDPQCGCMDDQQCSIVGTARKCVAEGTVAVGQPCGIQKCGPTLLCVQTTPSVSTCNEFCDDDADCQAPGGLCIRTLNDGMGGSIPDVTLCTEGCDPTTSAGCPVSGTSCQLGKEAMGQMRFFTFCSGAGTKTQMQACVPANDECAPSFGCFNIGTMASPDNVCLKYCKVFGAPCPGLALCQDIGATIGPDSYGACL